MIVALTGGIGSGKSTVLQMFRQLGVPVSSADDIARDLINDHFEIKKAIIDHFGEAFLDADGNVDRPKLRQTIFTDPPARVWLDNLLHPKIRIAMLDFAQHIDAPYCVIEIPLLLEANMQDCADIILTIDCTEQQQIERTMQRDNDSQAAVQRIIDSQITRGERLAWSDDVIENTGDLRFLQQQVEMYHQRYLAIASRPY